jgi:hypothetical protein
MCRFGIDWLTAKVTAPITPNAAIAVILFVSFRRMKVLQPLDPSTARRRESGLALLKQRLCHRRKSFEVNRLA